MKTKKRNKFFSMVLAVCMVCGLVMGNTMRVSAAGTELPEAFSQLAGNADYDAATGTITLTGDVTLTNAINIPTGTFSIDLAGHSVTSPTSCFNVYNTKVNLTLKDSSAEGTGTVISGAFALFVQSGANNNISIESGTYISTSTRTQSAVHVSLQTNSGSLNISGGNFLANYDALSLDVWGSSKVILTGGYFKTSGTVENGKSINIYNNRRTLASVIGSDCYVSLDGAVPIALADAMVFGAAATYAEPVRIYASAPPVPTPDSTQDSNVKAFVIDDTEPPVNVPTYTTTIPAEIDLGILRKSDTESIKTAAFEVTVSDVKNMDGKQVNVSVSTAGENFNLMKDTVALPFKVFNQATGGTALNSGDNFASFTENKTVAGRVEVDQMDITAAGSYSGTVTFNIALVDRAN